METTSPGQGPSRQAATPAVPPPDRVRIVSTPGIRGGKPRIDGHRITVEDAAVWHERMGMSPDEIVSNYTSLTLSDVYADLAYDFENRERIDADILEGEKLAEELRAGQPSIFEKVRQRIAADVKDDTLPPG
jgi:uncharacterized protein (DUF433 family)